MTEVKCKVKSCHYWGSGDVCQADSIMVDNYVTNASGRATMTGRDIGGLEASVGGKAKGQNFEAGDLNTGAGRSGDRLASTSEEAICRTFRPKNTSAMH